MIMRTYTTVKGKDVPKISMILFSVASIQYVFGVIAWFAGWFVQPSSVMMSAIVLFVNSLFWMLLHNETVHNLTFRVGFLIIASLLFYVWLFTQAFGINW